MLPDAARVGRPELPSYRGEAIDTIIMDGGHATRAVHLPTKAKCLALMPDGRPLLEHLLRYLAVEGINRVVVALSRGREDVLTYLKAAPFSSRSSRPPLVCTDVNPRRSGTVDAVRHVLTARLPAAFDEFGKNDILVLNGDTLLDADLARFLRVHHMFKEQATVLHAHSFMDDLLHPSSARILASRATQDLPHYSGQNLDRDFLPSCAYNYYDQSARFLDLGTPAGWAMRGQW